MIVIVLWYLGCLVQSYRIGKDFFNIIRSLTRYGWHFFILKLSKSAAPQSILKWINFSKSLAFCYLPLNNNQELIKSLLSSVWNRVQRKNLGRPLSSFNIPSVHFSCELNWKLSLQLFGKVVVFWRFKTSIFLSSYHIIIIIFLTAALNNWLVVMEDWLLRFFNLEIFHLPKILLLNTISCNINCNS